MVSSRHSILCPCQTRSEEDEGHKGNNDEEEEEKQEQEEDDDDSVDSSNTNTDDIDDDAKVIPEPEPESALTMDEGTTLVESLGKKTLAPLLVKAGMVFQDQDDTPNMNPPVDRAAAMAASKESSRNLAGAHLMRPSP